MFVLESRLFSRLWAALFGKGGSKAAGQAAQDSVSSGFEIISTPFLIRLRPFAWSVRCQRSAGCLELEECHIGVFGMDCIIGELLTTSVRTAGSSRLSKIRSHVGLRVQIYDQEHKLLEIGFEDPADVREISIVPARLPATSKTPSTIRRLFQQHDLIAAPGNRTSFPAAVAAAQAGDHCALSHVR
jgi:hypothetical protein